MFDINPNRKRARDLFNFNHFFSEFFPDNFLPHMEGKMMKIDIKEYDTSYCFDVELPGVKKEDIDINVNNDILTISIHKHEEVNDENTRYIRKERKYGSYTRSFSIPDIETDLITANYEDGVLKLTLPKITPEQTPERNITIE